MVANTLPPQAHLLQDITVLIQEQLSYSRKWKQKGSLKVDFVSREREKNSKIPRKLGAWRDSTLTSPGLVAAKGTTLKNKKETPQIYICSVERHSN